LTRRSTLRRTDKFVSALLRSASAVGIVAGIGAVLPATPARADCQPDPASSGQTVICTGVDHDGFTAAAGVENLDVRVRPNAIVRDNGVAAIDLNNRNTVTNNGTITTQGIFGILAGNRNTITNNNEILAGATATAIDVGNNNNVTNNGDITVGVAGTAFFGVNANTFTNGNGGTINLAAGGTGIELFGTGGDTVTNNGAITGGISTVGIESFGSHSTIINNGTITLGRANPSPSVGIFVNDHTTVINNNAIQIGLGGEGIQADGARNQITNNGSITVGMLGVGIDAGAAHNRIINNSIITAGLNGIGIWTGGGFLGAGPNHIGNFGSITTRGLGTEAVLMQNGGSLFNAGTIANTTPGGVAIDFCSCSTGYKLTIAPTSVITGLVTATGNDTFQLGGTGNGTFDLNRIGPTKQYEGFGVFNVVSGFWTVSKVFGQSDAWNVNGGTLSGTGTLADLNVNAGGTLQPGTTPGTAMKITGNLAFQSGALYVVTLNGTTSTLAKVSGTASLAGGVQALLQPGVTKQTYTILHSGGLGGTTFDSLTVAPGFTGTLTYTPTDVLLGLNANLGLGGNLNINQQNVANALNNFFNAGGALPGGFLPVFNLTGANLQNALTQLSGEANVDGQAVTFQQMTQFLSLMLDPFVAGRNGIGGGSGALGFAPEQEANFPSDIALAYDAILKAPPKPATLDQRWTAWGTAYGGNDKTNGDPAVGSNTFTANTFGFAAGMDYHPVPDTILGFALAGGGTNWTLAQALGSGRSDAFQAGVYGTKYFGPAYVAGSLAFANNWMTTNRTALGDQLTSSFNAQSVGGRVEAGYRYAVQPAIGVTPYGALQAQNFHTPSRTETDLTGGGFGLSFAAMNATDTRSELGARFDGLTTLNGLPLILRGRLAWAHDWVSDPALSAVFQALPGASFVVNGAPLPANSALASAGAELKLNPHVSLLGKFDGEFANGSQTYAGTGTLRYTW
jgi:uncharacterized protein with beta-barrel porin domain